MNVLLKKSVLGGVVQAIASKSQAHRLLICAALADTECRISCAESSEDIEATVRCLNQLGADIRRESGGFCVKPIDMGDMCGKKVLDCGESGSTLRFLTPLCCVLGADAVFYMAGRLPRRPLSPLREELAAHGCALSPEGENPLVCSGRLEGGIYKLPGNVSSQFISGLLFALPLLCTDSIINISGEIESGPYVDMTLDALSLFGIDTRRGGGQFRIRGAQKYLSPGAVDVEGDWSNAAFWLCAGAIGEKKITCANLDTCSRQGDKAVAELLERFGAKVEYGDHSVSVSRGELHGIEIDALNMPDLVPVLAVVASVCGGGSVIYNAGRLRLKESDRLRAVTQTLAGLGADIEEKGDSLVIAGKGRLRGGEVFSFGDHRIAMCTAIASTVCDSPVIIKNAEAVNKSYPGFFEDFAALGGKLEKGMD